MEDKDIKLNMGTSRWTLITLIILWSGYSLTPNFENDDDERYHFGSNEILVK